MMDEMQNTIDEMQNRMQEQESIINEMQQQSVRKTIGSPSGKTVFNLTAYPEMRPQNSECSSAAYKIPAPGRTLLRPPDNHKKSSEPVPHS